MYSLGRILVQAIENRKVSMFMSFTNHYQHILLINVYSSIQQCQNDQYDRGQLLRCPAQIAWLVSLFYSTIFDQSLKLMHAYIYIVVTAAFPVTYYDSLLPRYSPLCSPSSVWLSSLSQNLTRVNFFLYFLLLIVTPYKLMLFNCASSLLF